MDKRNRLAPESLPGQLINFLLNLAWAVVWLGRWTIRLLRRIFSCRQTMN